MAQSAGGLGVDISLIGDKELQKAFKKLHPKLQKKAFKKAARVAAKIVKESAKGKVPVAEGDLKKSIKVKAMKRSRTQVGVRIVAGTREELGIPADSKWYYPAIVEYGYTRQDGVFIPPQSYLRAARDAKERAAQNVMEREIRKGIEIEARSLRR